VAFLVASIILAFAVAIFVYFHLLRPRSESPSTLVEAAYQKRQQNNLDGAIANLTQSLAAQPDPELAAQIYSDRAYCYKLSSDWDKSIADLTAALAAEPSIVDKVRLLNDRGYAYIQVREPEAALADYTAVLNLDPKERIAASNRAWLTNLFTPKGRGVPSFFVFVGPQNIPDGVPPPVRDLWPNIVSYLNVEAWENPIPENEVRYNDPRYEPLAQRIVDELTREGLVTKGPVSMPPRSATPIIELWLATKFPVSNSAKKPNRSLKTAR
jgi:tetratricopeptide (TPR) repeat protein